MKNISPENTPNNALMPYVTRNTFVRVVEDITTRTNSASTALRTMSEDNPELYGLVVRLAKRYSMGAVRELQGVILGSTACYTALHQSLLLGVLPKVKPETCLSMAVSALSGASIGLGEADVIERDNPELAEALSVEANRFQSFGMGGHSESVEFGAETVYGALRRQAEAGWMSAAISL